MSNPEPAAPETTAPAKRPTSMLAVWMVVVMLIAAFVAITIWRQISAHDPLARQTQNVGDSHSGIIINQSGKNNVSLSDFNIAKQAILELAARLDKAEQQINSLKNAAATQSTIMAAPAATPAPTAANAEEMTALKNSLASLTASYEHLQEQLLLSKGSDNTQHQQMQVILYSLMRNLANVGQSFLPEFQQFQQASAGQINLQETIAKLEPLANLNTPTRKALQEKFAEQFGSLSHTVRLSDAKNWHERLWAEVQSLVVIRPLHSDPNAAQVDPQNLLTQIEAALSEAKLSQALTLSHKLPESAQDILQDWQTALEQRLALDNALAQLGQQIIAAPAMIAK